MKHKYTVKEQKKIVGDFFKLLRKKNVQSDTKKQVQREKDSSEYSK